MCIKPNKITFKTNYECPQASFKGCLCNAGSSLWIVPITHRVNCAVCHPGIPTASGSVTDQGWLA